jgi:hypothetical protein
MVVKKKSSAAHKSKASSHKEHKKSTHKSHKEAKNGFNCKLLPKDKNGWIGAGVFALIGLIIGVFLMSVMVASSTAPVVETNVDLVELRSEISDYINKNLIVDDTVEATVKDVNDLGNGLYELSFEVNQDGQVVGEGFVYSNGAKLILAQGIFDLDEPLEVPEVTEPTEPAEETVYTKSDTPAVDLYIMSFCPYGLQAVDVFDEPIKQLGEKIDFKLGYVVYSDFAKNSGQSWEDMCWTEDEKYCSLHGIEELKEDVRQMCIQRDQKDKLWAYMDLLVADYQAGNVSTSNIETMWKTYATTVGVDINAVEACVENDALTLLAEQKELNDTYGIRGSPTAIINETQYSGARTASAFQTSVCSAFNTSPEECGVAVNDEVKAAAGSC